MPKTTLFTIPDPEDLLQFFNDKFARDPSEKEGLILDFFTHQMVNAVKENILSERLNLCATLVLALSPKARQDYCLANEEFGGDVKREKIAKTVIAISSKNFAALGELIQESNRKIAVDLAAKEGDKIFAEVDGSSDEEKNSMREFCTDYTIFLAKEIQVLFDKSEHDMWKLGKLPSPAMLNNHGQKRKLLGHQEGGEAPSTMAHNPSGYLLRERKMARVAR